MNSSWGSWYRYCAFLHLIAARQPHCCGIGHRWSRRMSETERDHKRAAHDGETTPVPTEASGDTPPEHDPLTEMEEATGRTLSDDLTREATRLTSPEKEEEAGQ
jgi:hypothetical protein